MRTMPGFWRCCPSFRRGTSKGERPFPRARSPNLPAGCTGMSTVGRTCALPWRPGQARQRRAAPPSLEEFRGVVRPAPYRVEEKAAELLSLLRAEGPRRLTDLIRRSGSRSEATATFLALLELCREGKIHLAGEMDNPEVSWRSGT